MSQSRILRAVNLVQVIDGETVNTFKDEELPEGTPPELIAQLDEQGDLEPLPKSDDPDGSEPDEERNIDEVLAEQESLQTRLDDALRDLDAAQRQAAEAKGEAERLGEVARAAEDRAAAAELRVQELEQATATVSPQLPVDWSALDKVALEAEVAKRGLQVTGTGANGNVLVGDMADALKADDAKRAA